MERSDSEDGDGESDASAKSPSPKRARPARLAPAPASIPVPHHSVSQRQNSEPLPTQTIHSTGPSPNHLKRTKSSISSSSHKRGGGGFGARRTRSNNRGSKKSQSSQKSENEEGESEGDKRAKKKKRSNRIVAQKEPAVGEQEMDVDVPAERIELAITDATVLPATTNDSSPPPTTFQPAPTPVTLKVLGDKSNLTSRSPSLAPTPSRRSSLIPPSGQNTRPRPQSAARRSSIVQSPRIPIFRDPPISRAQSHQPRLQQVSVSDHEDINGSFDTRALSSALPQTHPMTTASPLLQPRSSTIPIAESTRIDRDDEEMDVPAPEPAEDKAGEFIPVVANNSSMIIEPTSEMDLIVGTDREKANVDGGSLEDDLGGGGNDNEEEEEEVEDTIILATVNKTIPLPESLRRDLNLSTDGHPTSPSPEAPRVIFRPHVLSPDASHIPVQLQQTLSDASTPVPPLSTASSSFFSSLPPRLLFNPPDKSSKHGPSKDEDDLAYMIRTTSTHENSDSDEEAFKATEKEIGVGVQPVGEAFIKRKEQRKRRLEKQILKKEDALVCEEGESDDEIMLRVEKTMSTC